MRERIHTGQEIARLDIGVSRQCYQAMKLAGFKPSHGAKTTASAVLAWLQAHPDFRQSDFYPGGRSRPLQAWELARKYPEVDVEFLARLRAQESRPPNKVPVHPSALGDTRGEPLLTHG